MDSSVGNILTTHLGNDKAAVWGMLESNTIVLAELVELRGSDIHDAIIYVSEAQNLSVEAIKLIVQRAGDDVKVIIEGDDETQIDIKTDNGMKRLVEHLRGDEDLGFVQLQEVYRSRIAAKVDNM